MITFVSTYKFHEGRSIFFIEIFDSYSFGKYVLRRYAVTNTIFGIKDKVITNSQFLFKESNFFQGNKIVIFNTGKLVDYIIVMVIEYYCHIIR